MEKSNYNTEPLKLDPKKHTVKVIYNEKSDNLFGKVKTEEERIKESHEKLRLLEEREKQEKQEKQDKIDKEEREKKQLEKN